MWVAAAGGLALVLAAAMTTVCCCKAKAMHGYKSVGELLEDLTKEVAQPDTFDYSRFFMTFFEQLWVGW